MIRLPKTVSACALKQIAIEDIKKPSCQCYWHSIGKPNLCLSQFVANTIDDYEQHAINDSHFEGCDDRDDLKDDYPDFDPLEDWDDAPCLCHWCRSGKPEWCVQHENDDWYCTVVYSAPDGTVPFDDVLEPRVRVNKFTRTSRHQQIVRWGRACENEGAMLRSRRSLANEKRKKRFMTPRRDRERISQVLAREEAAERELWLENESHYWRAYFPEDKVRITSRDRAELLQRNFPGLSVSSTHYIASSWRIQESSSFNGLEALQKLEEDVARKNEEYFCELEGYYPDDDTMCAAHALINSFNQAALLAFQH